MQFYAVLYGDEFGQMETFIQYFDENDERVEMVSIGMINQESVPRPPVDDWLPFQVPWFQPVSDIILTSTRSKTSLLLR